MRRLFLASLLTVAMAAPAAADDLDLGRTLVSELFGAVRADNAKVIDSKVADGVQLVYSSGALDHKAALKQLGDLKIEGAPVFSDWQVTREGPTVVVTYKLAASEMLDGKRTDDAPAPRMSVFLMTPEGWQLIAHANFKVAE